MRKNKSFIAAFLNYSKFVESPDKFKLWSAISIIGAALERKTWIVFNGTQYVYPNNYIFIVGPSGLAKKSSSTGIALGILAEVQGLHFLSTQLTAASLVKQLSDVGAEKTFSHNGTEFRHSASFAYSSEAAATLTELQGGGSIIELLTDFYDCNNSGSSEWSTTKYWSKETVGSGRIKIFNPCLNLLACSTPEWLVKTIGKDQIRGGFASRILFVVHKGKAEKSVGWLEDDELVGVDHAVKASLVHDLTEISKLQGKFTVAKGFGEVFNKTKIQIDEWLLNNQAHELNSYYSRKLWHILKLCQILSADSSNDLIITPQHFETAVKLLETIEPTMHEAFGLVGENPKARALNMIWEIMRSRGSITKQELMRLTFKNADARSLDEHIGALHTMQKIKIEYRGVHPIYVIIDGSPLS